MAHDRNRRGPSDATDYSSTQAPATRKYAEGRRPHPSDERLVPGGAQGADQDPGMGELGRDSVDAGDVKQTGPGSTEGDR